MQFTTCLKRELRWRPNTRISGLFHWREEPVLSDLTRHALGATSVIALT